jgi:hypothetical protein
MHSGGSGVGGFPQNDPKRAASPEEIQEFVQRMQQIKGGFEKRISEVSGLDNLRDLFNKFNRKWEDVDNDLGVIMSKSSIKISTLKSFEADVVALGELYLRKEVDPILKTQIEKGRQAAMIKSHNTEGRFGSTVVPSSSSSSSTSMRLEAIPEVDESHFPPQPNTYAQRIEDIKDTIKLKDKFKKVIVQSKAAKERSKGNKKDDSEKGSREL